jgi:hypothetical protein
MILLSKRFRSKAPSASAYSQANLLCHRMRGFDFMPTPYSDTASKGGECEGGVISLCRSTGLLSVYPTGHG